MSEVKASLDLSLSTTQINLVVNTVMSCSHGQLFSRAFVTGGYGSYTLGGFHNRYYLYSCEGLFCRGTNTCPSHLPCYYMCAGILLCKEFLDWIPHNWCGHSSAALFGIQVLNSKTGLSHGCGLEREKLFMPSIQKVDSPVDITWHSREADYVNESEQGVVSLQIHNWEDLIQSATLLVLKVFEIVQFICKNAWVFSSVE